MSLVLPHWGDRCACLVLLLHGRSDRSWDESVRLDLGYVENWSFALDLQIIRKTIPALLRGSGAF